MSTLIASTTVTPLSLLNLPNEVLLLVLKHVFVGARVRVIDPAECASIRAGRFDTLLQGIGERMKFWSSSKPPTIVSLQSALSILQTSKLLNTMGRPIFWSTAVFDFSHWSVHDLTFEGINYRGLPFDKVQCIQLSVYNLPIVGLDAFKSLKHLSIVSRNEDQCIGVRIELKLLLGMHEYWQQKRQFETDVLLTDNERRRIHFVVDQQGKFELIETQMRSFD